MFAKGSLLFYLLMVYTANPQYNDFQGYGVNRRGRSSAKTSDFFRAYRRTADRIIDCVIERSSLVTLSGVPFRNVSEMVELVVCMEGKDVICVVPKETVGDASKASEMFEESVKMYKLFNTPEIEEPQSQLTQRHSFVASQTPVLPGGISSPTPTTVGSVASKQSYGGVSLPPTPTGSIMGSRLPGARMTSPIQEYRDQMASPTKMSPYDAFKDLRRSDGATSPYQTQRLAVKSPYESLFEDRRARARAPSSASSPTGSTHSRPGQSPTWLFGQGSSSSIVRSPAPSITYPMVTSPYRDSFHSFGPPSCLTQSPYTLTTPSASYQLLRSQGEVPAVQTTSRIDEHPLNRMPVHRGSVRKSFGRSRFQSFASGQPAIPVSQKQPDVQCAAKGARVRSDLMSSAQLILSRRQSANRRQPQDQSSSAPPVDLNSSPMPPPVPLPFPKALTRPVPLPMTPAQPGSCISPRQWKKALEEVYERRLCTSEAYEFLLTQRPTVCGESLRRLIDTHYSQYFDWFFDITGLGKTRPLRGFFYMRLRIGNEVVKTPVMKFCDGKAMLVDE